MRKPCLRLLFSLLNPRILRIGKKAQAWLAHSEGSLRSQSVVEGSTGGVADFVSPCASALTHAADGPGKGHQRYRTIQCERQRRADPWLRLLEPPKRSQHTSCSVLSFGSRPEFSGQRFLCVRAAMCQAASSALSRNGASGELLSCRAPRARSRTKPSLKIRPVNRPPHASIKPMPRVT